MLTSFRYVAIAASAALAVSSLIQRVQAEESSADAHLSVLTERAAKIVTVLQLGNPEQFARVRDLIAQHYMAVGKLHDAGNVQAAGLDALHRCFLARLGAELTPEQVDVVKDGMTYGITPITLNAYQELLPQLTAAERREIHAQLLEAREYAMDAGSSEAKHATFGKYKGRINNYLSKAGYDLKQAEHDRAARVTATLPTR